MGALPDSSRRVGEKHEGGLRSLWRPSPTRPQLRGELMSMAAGLRFIAEKIKSDRDNPNWADAAWLETAADRLEDMAETLGSPPLS